MNVLLSNYENQKYKIVEHAYFSTVHAEAQLRCSRRVHVAIYHAIMHNHFSLFEAAAMRDNASKNNFYLAL